MDMKRNFGIILMMLVVVLTMNQKVGQEQFMKQALSFIENYWPLVISFIGIYIVSMPKKKR